MTHLATVRRSLLRAVVDLLDCPGWAGGRYDHLTDSLTLYDALIQAQAGVQS